MPTLNDDGLDQMNKNIPAIYFIRNEINLKSYIGSAVNVRLRINNHRSQLQLNKHFSIHLQQAVNKYGIKNFKFDILEIVFDKSKLLEREFYWIKECQSDNKNYGYNLRKIPTSNLGFKHSENTKLKMSVTATGRKRKPFSNEWKNNIGLASKGRKNTEETKKKMSESAKLRWRAYHAR